MSLVEASTIKNLPESLFLPVILKCELFLPRGIWICLFS